MIFQARKHLIDPQKQHSNHFHLHSRPRAVPTRTKKPKKTLTPGCTSSQRKRRFKTVSDFGFKRSQYDWFRNYRPGSACWFDIMSAWYLPRGSWWTSSNWRKTVTITVMIGPKGKLIFSNRHIPKILLVLENQYVKVSYMVYIPTRVGKCP